MTPDTRTPTGGDGQDADYPRRHITKSTLRRAAGKYAREHEPSKAWFQLADAALSAWDAAHGRYARADRRADILARLSTWDEDATWQSVRPTDDIPSNTTPMLARTTTAAGAK